MTKKYLFLIFLLSFQLVGFAQKSLNDFVTTWSTTGLGVYNDSSVFIGAHGNHVYNYDVDWDDDGVFDTLGVTGAIRHQYSDTGVYTIRIRGKFPAIRPHITSVYVNNKDKIISIDQWGDIKWKSMDNAFKYCSNLTVNALDAPILDSLLNKSLFAMFAFTAINGAINHWDVSQVANFSNMFEGASKFNQPLNNWDMSQAIGLSGMFQGASSFNQPLNNWDVSQVTSMSQMFLGASSFNQPINSWDVSQVYGMVQMFSEASSFNQPLNSWNVSQVKSMFGMFSYASSFNQPLYNWDVRNVRVMGEMFKYATEFDQPLGVWELNTYNPYGFLEMLNFTNLSTHNYDSTLIGWYNQGNIHDIQIGVQGLLYCNGNEARDSLIARGWTFNGDAYDCSQISVAEEPDLVSGLKMYPNPSNGEFTVELNQAFEGHFEIYKLSGQRVYQQGINGERKLELNVELAKGVYVLRFSSQKHNSTQRLVVQ